jgi:hypothetical protein
MRAVVARRVAWPAIAAFPRLPMSVKVALR